MNNSLGKLGPTAVVGALAVCCCWSYIDAPVNKDAFRKSEKTVGRNVRTSAASIDPAPQRDPFRRIPQQVPVADLSADAQPQPETQTIDPPPELILNATLVRGGRRSAMINGRLYAEGELLEPESASLTVTEIHRDKVLIRGETRDIELTWENGSRRDDKAASPPKPEEATPETPDRAATSQIPGSATGGRTSAVVPAHDGREAERGAE